MMALMDALKCNNNENEKIKIGWMLWMNDIKHTLKLGHERMFCRKKKLLYVKKSYINKLKIWKMYEFCLNINRVGKYLK